MVYRTRTDIRAGVAPRLRLDVLSAPVGKNGKNDRLDVAKVESLLGAHGYLDLDATGGPTGYAGTRLESATRRFQKDRKLHVDGRLDPAGETIRTLAQATASNAGDDTPTSNDGWLIVDPTTGKTRTPTPEDRAEHGIDKNEPKGLLYRGLEWFTKFLYDTGILKEPEPYRGPYINSPRK